jgi:hypothetical protein
VGFSEKINPGRENQQRKIGAGLEDFPLAFLEPELQA